MSASTSSSFAELAALGIEMEHAPCAFCGRGGGEPVVVGFDRMHDGPGRFQVVRCGGCGLLRTDPRPTIASIGRYYPADYAPFTHDLVLYSARYRWARWYPMGEPRRPLRPPGRLLEWGAAHGAFLAKKRQEGWDVAGIELDPAMAVRAAERVGAPIHCGDVNSAPFPSCTFDVICAWMVLEHLHDPIAALRRAYDWLVPGGWICLSVPDAGSWMFRKFSSAWFCLDVPRHLYHFSEPAARMVLGSCGFESIVVGRPGTIYDLAHTFINEANDRAWVSAARARRIFDYLPVRAAMFGGGYVAGALRASSAMTICARKPDAANGVLSQR
jgi:SAM-dependent methyltransferase